MTTSDRLGYLSECASLFAPFTGPFDRKLLSSWIRAELGSPDALDRPVPHGPLRSQALAPERLLHVVSENTPHAAFQSLLRGLTVGAGNLVKLPRSGIPELVRAVEGLPESLRPLVTLTDRLPDDWAAWAQVLVVFGSAETLEWFAARTPPAVRFLPHGPKLSIALVNAQPEAAAPLAARDVSLFDQRGCLSVHAVYLAESAGLALRDFAALLAGEMQRFNAHTPRSPLGPEETGRLSTYRESVRFAAATAPDDVALWESPESTDWTVIHERSPLLKPSPLARVVFVKPWPERQTRDALGPETRHLSTIALHPFPPPDSAPLLALGATRLCALGETQNPTLFWHHDGLPPLASLVTWVDLG